MTEKYNSEKQKLFCEMDAAIMFEEKPSRYIEGLSAAPGFREPPFDMLRKLKSTDQSPKHHPEGNVWNHTLMALDEAARIKGRSKNPRVFMWAALLHDIGKPGTTKIKNGKITSYNHDRLGEELSIIFLSAFTDDNEFIQSVAYLVRWHMQILFVVKDIAFAEIEAMKSQVDIQEIALLGLCDRLGRLDADRKKEEENIRVFLLKAQQ